MSVGLRDIVKMVLLCAFVWVFTQFIRNYTVLETIGMIVFVIIVYLIASLNKKRK
ncbi:MULTISPECIES: hypothetical protein [Bacillales]|jgi:hypothetical protein|nr:MULTISPECIES: hypothetical protein [Bacillales]EQM25229.1 hypothetical protein N399_24705 [Bacillus licheniformis CG-B52]MCY7562836.1 hypothetical protein [Paenibacillus macerans]MCY8013709.1 hypothetical protein [Bacillus haynesii]MEC0764894.1 hypothetical protein [Bacillus haynesii]MEC1458246.1 hypothetical protein [Bacillus haynesii]